MLADKLVTLDKFIGHHFTLGHVNPCIPCLGAGPPLMHQKGIGLYHYEEPKERIEDPLLSLVHLVDAMWAHTMFVKYINPDKTLTAHYVYLKLLQFNSFT